VSENPRAYNNKAAPDAMDTPDTESKLDGVISVLKGARIRDHIDLPPGEVPHRVSRAGFRLDASWASRMRAAVSPHESPGQTGRVNWREVAISAAAWLVIAAVIVALGVFCFRLVTFARGS
jgi:hypothetical protein